MGRCGPSPDPGSSLKHRVGLSLQPSQVQEVAINKAEPKFIGSGVTAKFNANPNSIADVVFTMLVQLLLKPSLDNPRVATLKTGPRVCRLPSNIY